MPNRKAAPRKKRPTARRAAPGGILTTTGAELRRRRKQAKLTQVTLSVEVGYSQNVVGLIERGVYNPTIVVLNDIATRLGIHVSELFIGYNIVQPWRGLHDIDNFPTTWITELRWRRV